MRRWWRKCPAAKHTFGVFWNVSQKCNSEPEDPPCRLRQQGKAWQRFRASNSSVLLQRGPRHGDCFLLSSPGSSFSSLSLCHAFFLSSLRWCQQGHSVCRGHEWRGGTMARHQGQSCPLYLNYKWLVLVEKKACINGPFRGHCGSSPRVKAMGKHTHSHACTHSLSEALKWTANSIRSEFHTNYLLSSVHFTHNVCQLFLFDVI